MEAGKDKDNTQPLSYVLLFTQISEFLRVSECDGSHEMQDSGLWVRKRKWSTGATRRVAQGDGMTKPDKPGTTSHHSTAELKYQLGPTATTLDMQLGWPSHAACLLQSFIGVEEHLLCNLKSI